MAESIHRQVQIQTLHLPSTTLMVNSGGDERADQGLASFEVNAGCPGGCKTGGFSFTNTAMIASIVGRSFGTSWTHNSPT